MRKPLVHLSAACFGLALLASSSAVIAGDLSGNISLEGRYFPTEPAYAGQEETGGFAISLEPEYKHKWDDENQQFTFTPYFRWDENDSERNQAVEYRHECAHCRSHPSGSKE